MQIYVRDRQAQAGAETDKQTETERGSGVGGQNAIWRDYHLKVSNPTLFQEESTVHGGEESPFKLTTTINQHLQKLSQKPKYQ